MVQLIQSTPYPSYTTVQRNALIGVPVGGFSIGDIIQFNLRRTPTGSNDTYEHDAILIKVAMHVCSNDRGSTNMYNN